MAEPERGNWTGKLDFLLSCLGYAVGLGNVWRFPYLCYTNGGGVFLIPYAIMLFVVGIPLFLMELTIGQYSARSPIVLFRILSPLWKGVGYCMFLASIMVAIYYNMIIAWTIYYMFASFTTDLPWQHCGQTYNTEACFSHMAYTACKEEKATNIYYNGTCMNATYANGQGIFNDTAKSLRKSAPEEYFNRKVLGEVEGIDIGNIGGIQWELTLSLLAAWIIVFLCLIKGIKSSGKVVYFTATFPYLVLTILLIRGALLEGSLEGIKFYMQPDWSKLYDINIWRNAAVQIFYSLSLAGGGLITLASYNKFDNNLVRDTLIVCFGNCLTSVYAGFAIFSILGHMAYTQNVSVSEVVTSSSGLAFIAYPEVVTRLPGATLWAILFFFMLLTLGLDSQFAIVENIVTSLTDAHPPLRKKKTWIILLVCVLGFLLGLPLCTQFVLINSLANYEPLSVGSYEYPEWANQVGYAMAFIPVALIVLFCIIAVIQTKGSLRELIGPTDQWGDNAAEFLSSNALVSANSKTALESRPRHQHYQNPVPHYRVPGPQFAHYSNGSGGDVVLGTYYNRAYQSEYDPNRGKP
ncbi:unnamed protein product [Cyprideis torosa]|uniref:Transporter n=1 Tax=Cyprideis torosa TaxID=163714 RepID=A0A7R8W820_9CRUS|nr:unnamed protein product [Cyprideis torosa]CAG0888136.1 unnamed protein product [Cyprideis torosa]